MPTFNFRLRPDWTELPRCSTVLNGHTRDRGYQVEQYRTTLSLKSVAAGSALYRTRLGRYLVDEDSFLLFNEGQEYWMDVSPHVPSETFCPFFEPGLVEHVAHCLNSTATRQLDDIDRPAPSIGFFERLYPKQGEVAARLLRLRRGLRSAERSTPWLEDQLYGLAAALVRLALRTNEEVASFPGTRASTRAELYRRLHRARDYLASCYAERLSVAALARVACLSPYHFQRMFRQAFGVTAMQCLQVRRLAVARQLLATTDRPITSICFEVGFESLGSFSALFHKRFGVSPRAFRRHGGRV